MNQLIYKDSGTANLHNLTSNTLPIPPKQYLWFQLLWRELIIMPLIMGMLRLTLQIFQLNKIWSCSRSRHPSNQINWWWWNGISSVILPLRTWWWSSRCWSSDDSVLTGGCPPIKIYTVSTVLFHKYGWVNVAFKNCMSHFYMFAPTTTTVKLENVNTGRTQEIGIILCRFPNFSIIYPVVPVYYFPGHPPWT